MLQDNRQIDFPLVRFIPVVVFASFFHRNNVAVISFVFFLHFDYFVSAFLVHIFNMLGSVLEEPLAEVRAVPFVGLRADLLRLLGVLREDLFEQELLSQRETPHRGRPRSHIHKLTALVTTYIVIANESTLVNIDGHLDSFVSF